MFFKKSRIESQRGGNEVKRCSFCHKAEGEVAKLISGPSACICGECVRVCTGLIASEPDRGTEQGPPPAGEDTAAPTIERTAYCAFCGRPIEWDEAVLVPERGAYCQACVADDSTPSA